ncbi:MAG TPA: hypothetical protein VKE42_08695 [Candidatus Cybelea sp.]|nr:hypothetical protein [Candidatus Cybelea sp.]
MKLNKVPKAIVAAVFALFFAAVGAGTVLAAEQVHMEKALNSLQTALTELQAAAADKGGHRDNAIKDVQDAISQTKAGMQAAKQ